MRLSPQSLRSFKPTPKHAPTTWLGQNKTKAGLIAAAASLAVLYVAGAVKSYRQMPGSSSAAKVTALGWPATAAKARVTSFKRAVGAAPHN